MSDFPQPDSYRHPLSDREKDFLVATGIDMPLPFLIKREKGAYVLDIDGNKYCDFSLHQGRAVYGHQPGVLSKIIKNGMSTSMGYAGGNKFLPRLIRLLKKEIEFTYASLYNSEFSLYQALLLPVAGRSIGVSSEWLLRELKAVSPVSDIEMAQKDTHYDVVFLEALDFERDLGLIDPSQYSADIRIAIITRSFYRTKNPWGIDPHQVDALAVGSSICNGMSSGILLSLKEFSVPTDQLSLPLSLAMLETLKFYHRKRLIELDFPKIGHSKIVCQKGSIVKISLDPQTFYPRGLLTNPDIQFLCPEHSEHDIRRLKNALVYA